MLGHCGGTHLADLLGQGEAKPAKVPSHFVIRVAKKILHSSHDLWVYRHMYFCKACGRVAGLRVVQLGARCEPSPISTTGVRNLRRLRQGQLPYGSPYWPMQVPLALRGHSVEI